jgi:hypothetical protein
MDEWKALFGRITLFPAPETSPSLPSADKLYVSIWGREADNYQRQSNALMPTVAQGKLDGVAAVCSVQPARIDFTLMPLVPQNALATPSLDLIENASQLHSELMRIIEIIGKEGVSCPSSRVAFSAQFLKSRESIAEANRSLTNVIPAQYRIQITDEEDFIFQINRPRVSRNVESVKMNIITKWSVDQLQVMSLSHSPAKAGGSAFQPSRGRFFSIDVRLNGKAFP